MADIFLIYKFLHFVWIYVLFENQISGYDVKDNNKIIISSFFTDAQYLSRTKVALLQIIFSERKHLYVFI